MVVVLEITPQPAGPEMPEPSPPVEPGPGHGTEVPSPDPRGPETPDHPIDPDPPLPSEPAEAMFRPIDFRSAVGVARVRPRRWIRPWQERRRAPCQPLRRSR
jgi:hypothetical protein